MSEQERHDGIDRCPHCNSLIVMDDEFHCPSCGKPYVELGEVEGHRILTERMRDGGSADLYRDRERGK